MPSRARDEQLAKQRARRQAERQAAEAPARGHGRASVGGGRRARRIVAGYVDPVRRRRPRPGDAPRRPRRATGAGAGAGGRVTPVARRPRRSRAAPRSRPRPASRSRSSTAPPSRTDRPEGHLHRDDRDLVRHGRGGAVRPTSRRRPSTSFVFLAERGVLRRAHVPPDRRRASSSRAATRSATARAAPGTSSSTRRPRSRRSTRAGLLAMANARPGHERQPVLRHARADTGSSTHAGRRATRSSAR